MRRFFYWHNICFFLLLALAPNFAMAADQRFTIGPGDSLEISVWRDESLSREVTVPPDGVLSFPLVGDINIIGMSVEDLRKTLKNRLKEYVPDATVTVILRNFNSLRAYVIGKVNKAGVYSINMDTNIMQVLSMAGGLNPYASEDKIFILRQGKAGTVKIPFKYGEVLKGRNLEQNIALQRGDVVIVP